MISIHRFARFQSPVTQVFSYIADFKTLKDYNPSILSVQSHSTEAPAVGAVFTLRLKMFGFELQPVLTITEFIENSMIGTRLDAFIPAFEKRHFKASGKDTLFSFTIEFDSGWPVVGTAIDLFLARFFAGPQADIEIRMLSSCFNAYR